MPTPRPPSVHFPRASLLLSLLLAALVFGGCNTEPKAPKEFLQFFAEAQPEQGIPFTLPVSHLQYYRAATPFLTAVDVTSVNEATVDLVDTNDKVLGLVFSFNSASASHTLMMASSSLIGKKIFVFADDKPIGVHPVTQLIQDGQLFAFIEYTNRADLDKLFADLQSSQKQIAEIKKSN